jgi:hypothetical protein
MRPTNPLLISNGGKLTKVYANGPMSVFDPLRTLACQLHPAPMAREQLWTGSQLLRKLLDDFLGGRLKAETFCRDVEVAYNEAIDEAALEPAEQPIFEELFNEVVWFSPIPAERWEYPGYKSEDEIRTAALKTADKLSGI